MLYSCILWRDIVGNLGIVSCEVAVHTHFPAMDNSEVLVVAEADVPRLAESTTVIGSLFVVSVNIAEVASNPRNSNPRINSKLPG